MKNTLRSLLLTTISLCLIGCDQGQDQADTNVQADDIVGYGMVGLAPESWAGRYLASRVAQERFDWANAEKFLEVAQTKKPDGVALERRLMILSLGAGNVDDAIKQAKSVGTTGDETGLTHLVLMLPELKAGQYIAAGGMAQALPKSPLSSYIRPLLTAWIDAAQGKPDLAPLRANKSYYYHRVLLADYLNQMGAADDVMGLLTGLDRMTPISAERLGDVFLRHGKYDLALKLYKAVEMLNPDTVNLKTRIEAAEKKDIKLMGDITLLPAVNNASEGIAEAFFDMATGFYNERSYETAQLFTRMALYLKPDMYEATLLLGNLMSRNNRTDDAVALYRQIPTENPRYRPIQRVIANLLVQEKRHDEAIVELQKLIAATPDAAAQVPDLIQIGDIYRDDEKFAEALKYYDRAVDALGGKVDKKNWELLYARGMTLERLKRWDDAEKDLKQAIDYQPEHPYLLNYLGYSWADMGKNLDEALKLLNKAVSLMPDDGYITDSVGWAYYRMKKFDKAVDYLERAVELMPYDPTINDHLGDAYWRVGRKREAEFQWHRAVNYGEKEEDKAKVREKLEKGLQDI